MSKVRFTTNHGEFVIEVNQEKAPLSAANFLKYVEEKHYDGTIFHRIIKNFMIQGGGFSAGMKQKKTNAPITNEADNGLKNDVYTVAMARTSDPHSASSQFFINVVDNEFLNFKSPTPSGWGYAVFGEVIEGKDIIDAMKAVKTSRSAMHADVPVEDVVVEKAEIIADSNATKTAEPAKPETDKTDAAPEKNAAASEKGGTSKKSSSGTKAKSGSGGSKSKKASS